MKLAFFAYFDGSSVPNVRDSIYQISASLDCDVDVINLFDYRVNSFEISLPDNFDLSIYNACIVHNTLAYDPNNLRTLLQNSKTNFDKFLGRKILLKQDENFKFLETDELISEFGFDVVFTCLKRDSDIKLVYPKSYRKTIFIQSFTGYVSDNLITFANKFTSSKRSIDFFYRGSIQPPEFGLLADRKHSFGDKVGKVLGKNYPNIYKVDISSRASDRINGNAWFFALGNAKATLGLESGASVFDLDGSVAETIKAANLMKFHNERSHRNYVLRHIKHLEGRIAYNQISPRIIECAAMRSVQILAPGDYSGFLEDGRNCLILKYDLSNIDEVLTKSSDPNTVKILTENAYNDLVKNPDLHINSFISKLKEQLVLPSKFTPCDTINGLILLNHAPTKDPRVVSFAKEANRTTFSTVAGLCEADAEDSYQKIGAVNYLNIAKRVTNVATIHRFLEKTWLNEPDRAQIFSIIDALDIISDPRRPKSELKQPEHRFDLLNQVSIDRLRYYSEHTLQITSSYLDKFNKSSGFDYVIACDFPTLLAGIIISKLHNIPLHYDAHEWWPFVSIGATNFEQEFWFNAEKCLVQFCDFRVTVNQMLAREMSAAYGVPFSSVPNATPLSDFVVELNSENLICPVDTSKVNFLFHGGLSEGRGLDQLIKNWSGLPEKYHLYIRGVGWDYQIKLTELAEAKGILDQKVFFLDPVDEADLVRYAADFDVGIIPYPSNILNHEYCCPNKLSQYLAAGLPILANNTKYVRSVVEGFKVGLVVDFEDVKSFNKAVISLAGKKNALWKKNRIQSVFKEKFNWNVLSGDWYEEISRIAPMRNCAFLPHVKSSGFCSQEFASSRSVVQPTFVELLDSNGALNDTDALNVVQALCTPNNTTRFKGVFSLPNEEEYQKLTQIIFWFSKNQPVDVVDLTFDHIREETEITITAHFINKVISFHPKSENKIKVQFDSEGEPVSKVVLSIVREVPSELLLQTTVFRVGSESIKRNQAVDIPRDDFDIPRDDFDIPRDDFDIPRDDFKKGFPSFIEVMRPLGVVLPNGVRSRVRSFLWKRFLR